MLKFLWFMLIGAECDVGQNRYLTRPLYSNILLLPFLLIDANNSLVGCLLCRLMSNKMSANLASVYSSRKLQRSTSLVARHGHFSASQDRRVRCGIYLNWIRTQLRRSVRTDSRMSRVGIKSSYFICHNSMVHLL